jgi:hypothetical protein
MSTLGEAMSRSASEMTDEDLDVIITHYRKAREEGLIGARKKALKAAAAPNGKINLDELDI